MRIKLQSVVRVLILFLFLGNPAAAAGRGLPADSVPGEVLVRIDAGASPAEVAAIEHLADADQTDRIAKVRSGTLWRMRSRSKNTEALTTALQKNPKVVYAEPNFIVSASATPNDPSYAQLWALKNTGQSTGFAGSDISAEGAWDRTTGSSTIVIGVVDTGINYTHPDLAANVWSNPGGKGSTGCAAGTHGFNAITRTCDPKDDEGHGSHTSGTIGAAGNNGIGVTGVNWSTSIMGLKFLASNGYGTTANAIAAIDFAVQAKIDGVNVRVLSNSWGSRNYSRALLDIINEAGEHDILFVASAGNSGSSTDDYPYYPAAYMTPNLISVAATDNRDGLAAFSNYGPTTVHLGAPGVGVLSTVLGSGYAFYDGTSMAAPHVAGVAALLLAKSPALTAAEVKSAILDNTDPTPELAGRTITGGRLNAARTLGAPPAPRFEVSATPTVRSVARGTRAVYTVTISRLHGFADPVALAVTGLPDGVTATFSPAVTTESAILTVDTTGAESPYSSMSDLTVTGSSGALTRGATVLLQVVPSLPAAACPSLAVTTILRYSVALPAANAIGDFNGDGLPDIVTTDVDRNAVLISRGDGLGAWQYPWGMKTGNTPASVAIADFNGDARLDVATANSGSHNVSILLGNGDGTLAPAVAYGAGTNPLSVSTGDFDHDGKTDLAVANNGSGDVSILMGAGDGTFATAVPYSAGAGPFWVSPGDFDGDGNADLAVATFRGNGIAVLRGHGDGTFGAALLFAAGTNPSAVAVADLNRDGVPDLAASNYGSANVSVLTGNGDGTFRAPVHYAAGDNPSAVATGDFNRDGKSDLIVPNHGSASVSLLIGNGDGTFQTSTNMPSLTEPSHIAVGDLDGDGDDDAVVPGIFYNYSAVAVLRNDGACSFNCGTFVAAGTVTVGTNPDSVAAGDFDGDGSLDAAAVNHGSNDVSVRLGNGDGTFAAGVDVDAGTGPDSVVAADLDHDGRVDLAVANNGSNDVSILRGQGDGTFATAVAYAAGNGPRSLAAADLDRDGSTDLAVANGGSNDVSILLGNGDATFRTATHADAGTNPSGITSGDFNRDGKADLAVSNRDSNDVSVLLGKGDGTFHDATRLVAGTGPSSILTADLDRDGKSDLAVANGGSNDVSVFLGNGNGTFQPAVRSAAGTAPSSIAAGDFNADGMLDLAVANSGSNDVSYLPGSGSPTFGPAVHAGAGSGPAAVTAAILDRDGLPDLVVANRGSGTLTVLRATCPAADVAVFKSHNGAFVPGSPSNHYTITVSNLGPGTAKGMLTVTDTLPAGLIATAISGAGWTCSLGPPVCTRSDLMPAGTTHPPIILTVDVASGAAASLTNQVTVSSPGDPNSGNDTAFDATTIETAPDMIVSIAHAGAFTQGDRGRVYTIVARNAGAAPTSGTVTVLASVPNGLSPVGMSGSGWTCDAASLTCTRGDVLAANGSHPPLSLVVDVSPSASAELVAVAIVSGGGETNTANGTGLDRTMIWSRQSCGAFGSAQRYYPGANPTWVDAGDLDGDGAPDLAVAMSTGVEILVGRPDGGFTSRAKYPLGTAPRSLVLADLDADGNLDIVTANPSTDDVSVLLGYGDASFAPAARYAAGDSPRFLATGDFDHDGHLDVVVSSSTDGTVSVLRGNGRALLPRVPSAAVPLPPLGAIVVADFEDDGKPDLMAASDRGGLWRFRGKGDGSFETAVHHAVGSVSLNVVTGDFNRDGKTDVASPDFHGATMIVVLGNGDGSFATPVKYSIGWGPRHTTVADINGDGEVDLLTASSQGIRPLLGNGDGTFRSSYLAEFSNDSSQFLVSDFNADGRPDIASVHPSGYYVSVFLGACADLLLEKRHDGDFTAGRNHTYRLTVTNLGPGRTQGVVTVTDILPPGLTPLTMEGKNWTCNAGSATCTTEEPLWSHPWVYPTISLTVHVSQDTPSRITNVAEVSGGGDAAPTNNRASDPTSVGTAPDLAITLTHAGNFAHGQSGKTYTITVGNAGSAASSGPVTVTDTLPAGMSATAMSGSGWACELASRTCVRSEPLSGGTSYPPITLTVSIDGTTASSAINLASVSGGNDVSPDNNTASDPTNVLTTPQNVLARGTSTTAVTLIWTVVPHATGYRVLRSVGANEPYLVVGSPLSNSFFDDGLPPDSMFFYRVQAADATALTPPSAPDPAITKLFTDDPLIGGTTIKAAHVMELRAAINAFRRAGLLAPFAFTDPSLAGQAVKRIHLTELRAALEEARYALGFAPMVYTDAMPQIVKAIHFREVRGQLY